jgi:hypothetical protein
MFHGNKSMLNNRETVGNGVFYTVGAKVLYNEDTSEAAVRCKGVCEVKTWRLV